MCTIKEEIIECVNCGEEIQDGVQVQDGVVCEECFDNDYEICKDCGKIELRMDMNEYRDNSYICQDCIEDGYEVCRVCGNLEKRNFLNYDSHNDNYVCDDCYDERDFVRCDECGCLEESEAMHRGNSISICDTCYENNNWYTCADCGDLADECSATYIESNDTIVCEDCADNNYYRCDCCGQYVDGDSIISDNETTVCENCYDRNYYTCTECDSIVHREDVYFDEDDCPYCADCYQECGIINSYDYKPTPIFHSIDNNVVCRGYSEIENTLYLGIELEVDKGYNTQECVKMVQDKLDWCYCKKDGSLDDGFEIVSHPMTLEFIQCKENTFKETFEYLTSNDWRSHDTSTCGLHCHVNRTFFGDSMAERELNIAKVVLIVNLLWDDMVKFSRRTETQLEKWCKRNNHIEANEEFKNKHEEEVIQECKRQYNRYYAINLENYHTIEFRLFKGTLKLNTFIATMQFVSNICNMAKEIKLSDIYNVTMEEIINYNNYKELKIYAKERGII